MPSAKYQVPHLNYCTINKIISTQYWSCKQCFNHSYMSYFTWTSPKTLIKTSHRQWKVSKYFTRSTHKPAQNTKPCPTKIKTKNIFFCWPYTSPSLRAYIDTRGARKRENNKTFNLCLDSTCIWKIKYNLFFSLRTFFGSLAFRDVPCRYRCFFVFSFRSLDDVCLMSSLVFCEANYDVIVSSCS